MTTEGSIVRHPHRGGKGGRPFLPAFDHPAVVEGRTIFPSSVQRAEPKSRILKSGHHNPKIGKVVMKGRWKGMPIYTLTLEERATCPRTCLEWRHCYGNSMHLADRFRVGARFELLLELQIRELAKQHPQGFVVRLHVLGDFYSEAYALRWWIWMTQIEQLHVFGFTARIDPDSPITQALARIRREFPDRWWIRFSGADMATMASEVVDLPDAAHPDSIVCPQQTGRTLACATCGLCWASKRNIAFLRH